MRKSTFQLDDTRRMADAEARDRSSLLGKFRALEADLERLREKIEAETEAKADLQKAMSRANAEAQVAKFCLNHPDVQSSVISKQVWKSKFNTEASARIDDLESARAKLLVGPCVVKACKQDIVVPSSPSISLIRQYG